MEESPRGQSPLSVLVAEDEDALRHVLRRALEKTGFTVFEASNGKKALEIFQKERPSIVLLDAVMPGMNGFELCAHLRQAPGGARLPILIITSLEDESSVTRAFGAGATDYLTKPVRITVLCQRILRLVQASRAEAQLAETNAYLQSLVYHVPDGVVTFDERGIIESFNPSAEQILGFSASEAIGKSIQYILGLPSQTSFVPSSTRQETFARRKDGSVFNLEVSVSEFDFRENKRFTAILRDITSRKQAEIELRNSQQKFEALVNSIDGIVFEVDIETFRFQFVSRQVELLLGYPQQRWIDEPGFWESLLHPDDREEAVRYCKSETTQGRDHEFEYRMIAADGRELWFRDLVRVVCEDGKPRLLRGVMVDITKQRQTEVALHRSQKMEAVGRLAGGVAHDFNNLLTVIKGYSQLLLKSQPPDSIPRQYVEEIKKSADRSSALIRQLLAFSRRQVLQPHVIDLNALILDIREMLERLISEDIELGLSLDPALGRVKADPGQMEQVIMNLVVNARDAMPGGGILSVITGNVELDEAVVHGRLDA
ncbi:MAG TPA: PAS domain S-box protein, partial [Acidobacteriota bacterium]|nr:PAS domain S-box protein [Acidobacteriota bacterium]